MLSLHRQIIAQSGGALGVRDLGSLESALAQPRMTFGGEDLHPMLVDKAAALGFSIVMNYPFVDGNKRTGSGWMRLKDKDSIEGKISLHYGDDSTFLAKRAE